MEGSQTNKPPALSESDLAAIESYRNRMSNYAFESYQAFGKHLSWLAAGGILTPLILSEKVISINEQQGLMFAYLASGCMALALVTSALSMWAAAECHYKILTDFEEYLENLATDQEAKPPVAKTKMVGFLNGASVLAVVTGVVLLITYVGFNLL